MISMLTGRVVEATASCVLIDVNGIGFEVGISQNTASALPQAGQECRLYTRMVVREDAMTLYGFADTSERTMFDRLVSITGVGPKLALSILSTLRVPELYATVLSEDLARISKVPGVGKKTAQRLVLELKGPLSKDPASEFGTVVPLVAPSDSASAVEQEAREALLGLGFTSAEVARAFEGMGQLPAKVEDAVASALRMLGMDR